MNMNILELQLFILTGEWLAETWTLRSLWNLAEVGSEHSPEVLIRVVEPEEIGLEVELLVPGVRLSLRFGPPRQQTVEKFQKLFMILTKKFKKSICDGTTWLKILQIRKIKDGRNNFFPSKDWWKTWGS